MTTSTLTRSFHVGAGAIAAHLIVAATGTGRLVGVATGSTDALIGAADAMGGKAGGLVDVDVEGFSTVRYGAAVDFGDPLTSDAAGKAVKAVPVAGSVVRIIGFAMCEAEADDLGDYRIAPGLLATPAGGG